MRAAVALLLCGTAFAARAERPPPTAPEWALLVAAETSLAVDMLQTLDIKRHPAYEAMLNGRLVRFDPRESNPLLGSHPDDTKVYAYFAGAMLLTGATWYALPSGWRMLAPGVVLALQVPQVILNARAGYAVRF